MDRLTQTVDGQLCTVINTGETVEYRYGDDIDKLAAYEDTGLTPEEVAAMKEEYSDTFQAHLQQLCDIKDKRIAELEAENARLRKYADDAQKILCRDEELCDHTGEGEDNAD